MRVIITGASSFTGLHIIKALSKRGVSIIGTATRPVNDYGGLKKKRLNLASKYADLVDNASFGSKPFIQAILHHSPDVLIHHGAMTTGYRRSDFNVQSALDRNCFELEKTLKAFSSAGGEHIWLTGSIFQGDANGVGPISPYGESKQLTAKRFSAALRRLSLRFSESILSNPIGPYDNEKLCDYLFDQWSVQQSAIIKTPNWVRDNIFVGLLASAYAEAVFKKCVGRYYWSGFQSTMWAFVQRVAAETRQRTGWACDLISAPNHEASQPLVLLNSDSATSWVSDWSERLAWDELIEWQLQRITS